MTTFLDPQHPKNQSRRISTLMRNNFSKLAGHCRGSTTPAAPGVLVGSVAIGSSPLDLSSNYNLRITDTGTAATNTVDCRGATPQITTLAEIITAINTAFSATVAYDYNNYLALESTDTGSGAQIQLTAPPANDALEEIMGSGYYSTSNYPYTGTGADGSAGQIWSRTGEDVGECLAYSADGITFYNILGDLDDHFSPFIQRGQFLPRFDVNAGAPGQVGYGVEYFLTDNSYGAAVLPTGVDSIAFANTNIPLKARYDLTIFALVDGAIGAPDTNTVDVDCYVASVTAGQPVPVLGAPNVLDFNPVVTHYNDLVALVVSDIDCNENDVLFIRVNRGGTSESPANSNNLYLPAWKLVPMKPYGGGSW